MPTSGTHCRNIDKHFYVSENVGGIDNLKGNFSKNASFTLYFHHCYYCLGRIPKKFKGSCDPRLYLSCPFKKGSWRAQNGNKITFYHFCWKCSHTPHPQSEIDVFTLYIAKLVSFCRTNEEFLPLYTKYQQLLFRILNF